MVIGNELNSFYHHSNLTYFCRPDVQEEMNRSLASMRVDYGVILKNLDNSSNSLLSKRKNKANGGLELAAGESSTNF